MAKRKINTALLASNLAKLPDECAAINPSTQEKMIIRRGEEGYYPLEDQTVDVNALNKKWGVAQKHVSAMLCGSMFGWDVPGADPDRYQTIN